MIRWHRNTQSATDSKFKNKKALTYWRTGRELEIENISIDTLGLYNGIGVPRTKGHEIKIQY